MSKRSKKSAATDTVTIRMATDQIARLDQEAAAALMSRSAYIQARLGSDESESFPTLAALGEIIAIHQIAAKSDTITSEHLAELKRLVLQLTQSAHREAEQLR